VTADDEVGETARALNAMADRLCGSIRTLEAQRRRLAAIFESLAEGILVVAPDRTVRLMNREAARLLGLDEIPGPGRPYPEVVRQPEVLAFLDAWWRATGPATAEAALPAPGGERTVCLAAAADADGEGDLLVTMRDVTEERRLMRVKSDFVANASHELRTPLTNIRGYLEAMQDALREGQPADPSFLAVAHENALRMERLIDDLLALSRAEAREAPPEKEELRLADLLEKIRLLHAPAARERGKVISVAAPDTPFRADAKRLLLAVSNLVDNAVKYGGRRIDVTGRAAGGWIEIEVADDGPGIPAEHLPRIFERFYRVDRGRSRALGGTGLGLSIARHVVEAHGGTVGVRSAAGEGTRFSVRIPSDLS